MSQQGSRNRGVILTSQGLQKLQAAKSEAESNENFDRRYTREALGIRTGLDPDTVAKVFACEIGVDKQTLKRCFHAFNLELSPTDYHLARPKLSSQKKHKTIQNPLSKIQNCLDWGEAPDVSLFFGRTKELATLKQWISAQLSPEQPTPCRLITLLGIPGIGKTWLSVKLAQELQEQFEFVIWRSLHPPVSPQDLLTDLLTVLSQGQNIDLPNTIAGLTSRLIRDLQRHRCLLILDNADFVWKHCLDETPACQQCAWFPHKSDAQAYCTLLQRLGETTHQSCVILSSREKPRPIAPLEGPTAPVRVFPLHGLTVPDVQQLFNIKGTFQGNSEEWSTLVNAYAGNPLALNLVSATIQSLFSGQIAEFLQQQTLIFGQVCTLVEDQLRCLPTPAQDVLTALAVNSQPISFNELRSRLATSSPQTLLEILETLQARSLIKTQAARFSLQPLIMEYIYAQSIREKTVSLQPYPPIPGSREKIRPV